MNKITLNENGEIDLDLGDIHSSLVMTEQYCPRCGRITTVPLDGEPGLSIAGAKSKWVWYHDNLFRGETRCKSCCKLNEIEYLESETPSVPINIPIKLPLNVSVDINNNPECDLIHKYKNIIEEIEVTDESFIITKKPYEIFSHDLLWTFKPEDDVNALLGVNGSRWLCRGGTVLEASTSGTGKSVSRLQRALSYRLGLPAFGIAPVNQKKLKSLVVQPENDFGDEAEIFQGVVKGLSRVHCIAIEDILDAAREGVILTRLSASGNVFAQMLERLLERHQPDIVFIDPMFPYWGAALSDLGRFTEFTRNEIGPILEKFKVAAYLTHHFEKTGKAYFGPSDLKNWVRADVEITRCEPDPKIFCFGYNKRGERSGVPDQKFYARHSEEYIFWEDAIEPVHIDCTKTRQSSGANATTSNNSEPKTDVELQRALSLVKCDAVFDVKDMLALIKTAFGCQQRKSENLWQLMRERGQEFNYTFLQVAPGKYTCETKPF